MCDIQKVKVNVGVVSFLFKDYTFSFSLRFSFMNQRIIKYLVL